MERTKNIIRLGYLAALLLIYASLFFLPQLTRLV